MTTPRLDFLSPLPPVRSGISDYSVDLLPFLRALCDVRVVRLPEQPVAAEIERRFHPVAFEHLGEDGRLPLYQIGNNRYHEAVRAAALRLPGVMMLHDVVLHHLLLDQTIGRGVWEPYPEQLRADHGWIGAAAAAGPYWGTYGQAAQFALAANRTILRRQRGVLVHSAWAARGLADEDPELRVRVVPMAVPLPPAADPAAGRAFRVRHGLPLDRPLLGSFGFQTPIKRTTTAIEALARPELGEARLLIVGEAAPTLDLLGPARAAGVADRLHVLGYVPFEEFGAAVAACDLCLNLRYPTAGETSASLLRVLAMGRACLVSDYAQFAELPDAVAVKVPIGEGEVEAFAAIAAQLLAQPERLAAMGRAARQWVQSENDPEKAARAVVEACGDFADCTPLAERRFVAPPATSLLAVRLAARLEVEGAVTPWPEGERRKLRVRLTNQSDHTFLAGGRADGGVAIRLRLEDARGRDLLAGRRWLPVTRDLGPGESFAAEVEVRRPAGRARLRVEPHLLGREQLEIAWTGEASWDREL